MSTVAAISKLHGLLSFERRTLTEIATALSVVAVAGSTLYNLGFFAPIEWSFISVLSVQDLLIGASTALLPMGVARSEERRVGKECRSRWSPYH